MNNFTLAPFQVFSVCVHLIGLKTFANGCCMFMLCNSCFKKCFVFFPILHSYLTELRNLCGNSVKSDNRLFIDGCELCIDYR